MYAESRTDSLLFEINAKASAIIFFTHIRYTIYIKKKIDVFIFHS